MTTLKKEEILLAQKPVYTVHKSKLSAPKKNKVYISYTFSWRYFLSKRLSPFLIAFVLLPMICLYWLFIETSLFQQFLLGFGLLFGEAYLAYFDVALWKYYSGKRRLRIWLIELTCIVMAVIFFTLFISIKSFRGYRFVHWNDPLLKPPKPMARFSIWLFKKPCRK